jgi:hypothetical protein
MWETPLAGHPAKLKIEPVDSCRGPAGGPGVGGLDLFQAWGVTEISPVPPGSAGSRGSLSQQSHRLEGPRVLARPQNHCPDRPSRERDVDRSGFCPHDLTT